MTDITIERRLPVINGFVEIPDGKGLRVTPAEALELIPGSTLVRLGVGSTVSEIKIVGEGEEAPPYFANDYALLFNNKNNAAYSRSDPFVSSGPYSFSCWVRQASVGHTYMTLATLGRGWSSPAPGRFALTVYNAWDGWRLQAREADTDGNNSAKIHTSPLFGTSGGEWPTDWVHIVYTSKGNGSQDSVNIYANAVLVGTGNGINFSNTPPHLSHYMWLGSSAFTNYWFDGKLDECAFWTRELSYSDIISLYNDGAPTNLDSTHAVGLRNWWRMGDDAKDDSGNIAKSPYGGTIKDVAGASDMITVNMSSTNKTEGIKVLGNTAAYALSNTARQHQGDVFIKLPAYNATASSITDMFEQLRTGEVPQKTITEEEEIFTNTYSTIFPEILTAAYSTIDPFVSSGPYSFSCWVRQASVDHTYMTLATLGRGWNAPAPGRFALTVYNAGNGWQLIGREADTDGNDSAKIHTSPLFGTSGGEWPTDWVHIVYTSKGNGSQDSVNIYANAVLVGTGNGINFSNTPPHLSHYMWLGSSAWTNYWFDGSLDECAFWTRELPATGNESVESLFDDGPADLNITHPTNLRNWWRMGDAPGDNFATGILEDVVGTSDMTLTNMDIGNKSTDVP